MDKKPFKDTLWMDCLFECIASARETGLKQVLFEDVDRLVLKKSHNVIEYKTASETVEETLLEVTRKNITADPRPDGSKVSEPNRLKKGY